MTAHRTSQITRPGGPSAKNAHRAGAPNTQPSGENPMVGTNIPDDPWACLRRDLRRRLGFADHYPDAVRAATLWELLKAQTRNARDLRARLAYWQAEARKARMDGDRLDRQVRAALGAPAVGGSCVAWAEQLRAERDEFAAESEHRETEIVELTIERDRAEDRVTELESALVGESR